MLSAPTRRNDPCPCGSGKRYKDCHGSFAEAAALPRDRGDSLIRQASDALQRNDFTAAIGCCEELLKRVPGNAAAWRVRARAEFGAGHAARAAESARKAVALDEASADAWTVLGLALEAVDPPEALAAWEKAAGLAPAQPEAYFRIGNLQRRQGNHDAAVAAYRRALNMVPRHPVLLNNLGLALQARGELAAAERSYRDAIDAQPAMLEAIANLASVLQEQSRFDEAIPWFERALSLRPDAQALWTAIATCLYRIGDHARARTAFERALECGGDDPKALVNMASMLLAAQGYGDALPLLERALAREPEFDEAENVLLYANQQICRWDDLDALFSRQRQRLRERRGPPISPHNLLALPYTPAEQLEAARDWVERHIGAKPVARPAVPRHADGRVRLAYLGADFRSHPLANQLTEVIETHDRTRFEVLGYSFGPDDRSEARARFARAFDRFADVRDEASAATAERLRRDGVAILFDTGGHVLYARGEIFAGRPAPLQINCIGFPATLGADYYDYILTDRFVSPEGEQVHFNERFLYLPHCYMPGDSKRPIGVTPTRAQVGLPDGGFVFCSFNGSYKIQPALYDVWMRLLAVVPGSVLWLLDTHPLARSNLVREAVRRGVSAERLVFAPRVPVAEHLARHALADLFLDTFPCNAHTTANDALFAGLPIVTCAGETFASRVAGSHLHAIGLPELVAYDLAAYEALAVRLAQEPDTLAALRARLHAARATQPLFDTAGWTRALETLLLRALDSLG
jgi:protein O-GlcNAc transferase